MVLPSATSMCFEDCYKDLDFRMRFHRLCRSQYRGNKSLLSSISLMSLEDFEQEILFRLWKKGHKKDRKLHLSDVYLMAKDLIRFAKRRIHHPIKAYAEFAFNNEEQIENFYFRFGVKT